MSRPHDPWDPPPRWEPPPGWEPPRGWEAPGAWPAQGKRPPGRRRSPRHGQGNGPLVAALAGVFALVVLAVVGVVTIDAGQSRSLGGPPPPPPPPPPPSGPVFTQLPGPTSPPETTEVADGIDVTAGECVRFVVATDDEAQVAPVECSSPDASHVVVDRVSNRAECPDDIDVTYYETRLSVETLALCLDVNWMVGACYDITDGPAATEPVACAPLPDRRVRQVEAVLTGTTALDGCSGSGIVYSQRRFVVCVRPVE